MPSVPRYLDQYQGLYAVYSVDIPAITADVAGRLGVTVEQAQPCVEAAIDYICDDTGLGTIQLPPDDSRLVSFGIPLLAMRMYQDTPLPSNAINEFDPTFAGSIVPQRLYSHLDEYWRHLAIQWGIA